MKQTPQAIVDIECYVNYFLVSFMRLSDNKVISFEQYEDKEFDIEKIKDIMSKYETISFNGNKYDLPMLHLALKGASCQMLKKASDEIINGLTPYKFYMQYNLVEIKWNHIDIIELCIGKNSLKTYAGRLHCKKLQDLPINEAQTLQKLDRSIIKEYCQNDLEITNLLFQHLAPQVAIRRLMSSKYNVDLRSKSDAQIAEAVIKAEIKKIQGYNTNKNTDNLTKFKYDIPEFISFETDKLNNVLKILQEKQFIVNNKIEMPRELSELKIKIGISTYQMGIGGLHSTEKSVHYTEDENFILCDFDVTSYYPSIILNCGLYPVQLGKDFLTVYQDIVEERVIAKQKKDTIKADTLKIVVNGSFGKLGSQYSILYSPKLMVQVTITGQLSLLMLIDSLEERGIKVVSGNTDGVVIKCQRNKEAQLLKLIEQWEHKTGFKMERTDYKGIFSRDVNNYVAIKHDGKVKTKGCFSNANIGKNPQNDVCNEALINYLVNKTPFAETIQSCVDITKFLTLRNVKGGAVKNNQYMGKVVRWYYSTGNKSGIYYKNGNLVPRSIGTQPLMNLPQEFPQDIDYDWYVRECEDLIGDLGLPVKGQMNLF